MVHLNKRVLGLESILVVFDTGSCDAEPIFCLCTLEVLYQRFATEKTKGHVQVRVFGFGHELVEGTGGHVVDVGGHGFGAREFDEVVGVGSK